jgi:hypothetical protein
MLMIAAVLLICLLALVAIVALIVFLASAVGRGSGSGQPVMPPYAGPARSATLVIRLPEDRNRCGVLYVRDAGGAVLAGPFPALGRTADVLAARAGNPQRLRTRPGGDTPLGGYRLKGFQASHPNFVHSFGPYGRILLAPLSGEAALAEAAGRFELALISGRLGPFDRLRATDGAIRLHDRSMWSLQQALRGAQVDCEIRPLDEFDPLLQGWDSNSLPPCHVDDIWDPVWTDPAVPPGGFVPDVGPELTGTWSPSAGEAAAAAIGVAAGVAIAAEVAESRSSNAYDP